MSCFPLKTKLKGQLFCLEHSMDAISTDLEIVLEAKGKKCNIVGRNWTLCCVTFGKALNFSRPYILKYTPNMSDVPQNPCFPLFIRYTTRLHFPAFLATKCDHVAEL